MEILDIMKERHSVRQYTEDEIENNKREILENIVKKCNEESGLNIQIIYNEPKCFRSLAAHYGSFRGVSNYIAIVGEKSANVDEIAGYYGEKIVLRAQELGLNTCWTKLTYNK